MTSRALLCTNWRLFATTLVVVHVALLAPWSHASPLQDRTSPSITMDPLRVNAPGVPYALKPLRWGTVNPNGWILDWANAAKDGAVSPTKAAFATLTVEGKPVDGWLHGRPDVGGFWDEDSAYWIDGMARLGFVLQDDVLINRAKADIESVMEHPYRFHNTFPTDVVEGWVRSIYSRGLLAYFDGSNDTRVIEFLKTAYANYTAYNSTMNTDQSHQGSRSMTQMEVLLESHAYGAPVSMAHTAISLMGPEARNGGYDFLQNLLSGCLDNETAILNGACEQHAHGVTFNEVAKLFAMAYVWTGNTSHLAASHGAYEMIEKYDMQPHGVNSADEDMNGISPNVATETCDVSDFIYSSSWMYRVTGDSHFGDRLEKAFHNAAPGAVNRSFSGHVYFQSPNYAQMQDVDPNVASDKWQEMYWHGPPCCTGNQARMLPNYIHHMWFGTADGGLAATMYGPNKVTAEVGAASTSRNVVTITSSTSYPFDNVVSFTISVVNAHTANFEFLFRVPGWTNAAQMAFEVNGERVVVVKDQTLSGFVKIVGRTWNDGDVVKLTLVMNIRATVAHTINNGWFNISTLGDNKQLLMSPNGGFSQSPLKGGHKNVTAGLPFCVVERGPLLFALALEITPHREQATAPPPFNFAVVCDSARMVLETKPTAVHGGQPFDWPLDAPLKITVQAQQFDWPTPWRLPASKVAVNGPLMNLTLVPYGCAKQFHVSMFPLLDSK
eukprot:m.14498 g.14498  ORF g.14498 m.14498 type:complete len:723 (-) comp10170_c0_seq1:354-2522(-)